jgi:Metallo-peptidase family M12
MPSNRSQGPTIASQRAGATVCAAAIASCAMLGASLLLFDTAFAQDTNAQPRERTSFILSKLPAKGTPEHDYLKQVSGTVVGEALPMSGSEMWSVHNAHTDMLMHVADEQGIEVMMVEDGFNKLLTAEPEAAKTNMAEKSKAMIKRSKSSDAVTDVTILSVKHPAMVEFAFGRGEKPMVGESRGHLANENEIEIPLNANQTIKADRLHVETTDDGCFWHGRIKGTQLPISLMWWPSGRMSGAFDYDGKSYVIRHLDGASHAIVEIDPEKMPPEHPIAPGIRPGRSPYQEDQKNLRDARAGDNQLPPELADLELFKYTQTKAEKQVRTDDKDAKPTISVLFVYTKKVAEHYSHIRKDLFALAVEQTNHSFRASKVENVEVDIVGSELIDYDESGGNLFNHLWRLADKGDGHMEEVHQLRDEKRADIVILVVDSPTGCGLATRVAAYADEAFAAVHHECATTTFSVAHEIGHLIGARHDRALDKSTRPFPYGHGYVNAKLWRTMMSYKSSCDGCPRLPVWSNPELEIDGDPAGDPETHNARVIAEQAARVARFR